MAILPISIHIDNDYEEKNKLPKVKDLVDLTTYLLVSPCFDIINSMPILILVMSSKA